MKYNFDEIIPRRGTNCVKWDECPDPEMLPLWVADMDFQAAPCIRRALQRRLDHGVFGYALVPESYYEAVIQWFSRRHGWTMQRDHILYTTGVVPAIAAILRAHTIPSEKVLPAPSFTKTIPIASTSTTLSVRLQKRMCACSFCAIPITPQGECGRARSLLALARFVFGMESSSSATRFIANS